MATGRNGSPVTTLTRSDFQVFEQGKLQKVSAFTNNNLPSAAAAMLIYPRLASFSNFSNPSNGPLNVLLLDQMDTDWKSWRLAWSQVLKFIQQLSPDDHLAIYSLDAVHGLQVIQDYNNGSGSLLDKFRSLKNPSLSMLLPSAQTQDLVRPPSFAQRNNQLEAPELLSLGHIQDLTAALNLIADHMAGIPEPKSLIWVAGRFPNPFQSVPNATLEVYRSKMLVAVNHLISADVAVYPVDARELSSDHSFDVENEDIGIHPLQPGETPNLPAVTDVSTLLALASRSGGKAYFNTNDLMSCLRNAANQSSYTLGFYRTGEVDNKYHSLRVVAKRKDVHLRYRPGYWGFSPATGSSIMAQDQLAAAVESPFTVDTIRLQANIRPEDSSPEQLGIRVYIDSANLSFQNQQGALATTLDVLFGQKDTQQRIFAVPPYRVPLQITQSALESHKWLTTETKLALRSQSRAVRVVVRDENSGRLGSVDIPLEGGPYGK